MLGDSTSNDKEPYLISKFKTKWFWLRPKNAFYIVDVGLHGGNYSTNNDSKSYSIL